MPELYKHREDHERDLLSVLRSKGKSIREIADDLKRSSATVSRELTRNAPPVRMGCYLAHKAHARAVKRGWSPKLIAGRLKKLHPERSISHEAGALGNRHRRLA